MSSQYDHSIIQVVLLSKELKYFLAADKVKTLDKAEKLLETLSDGTKKNKIIYYKEKYSEISKNVENILQQDPV